MLDTKTGTVKFFRADKGWGFIVPADGSENVYFHVNYYSGVTENYPGELELTFDQDSTLTEDWRAPKTGETLIYETFRSERGLMAIHWLRPRILERAQKMLAIRQVGVSNPFTRVMKTGTRAEHYRPTLIWKGTKYEFELKLDEGFPEMHDPRYYVEELDIASQWKRRWHPNGWHEKYMTPHGEKLPGTRIRLHKPAVQGVGVDGVIRDINGYFDENGDGMFKNPSYGVVLDGYPGVVNSFRRSDFDIIADQERLAPWRRSK